MEDKILKFLINHENLNVKSAKRNLENISRHKDIYDEFKSGIIEDGYKFTQNLISVEGYTAKKLYEETNLQIIGAYNYLIFLREESKSAKDCLAKGLPVK